VKHQADILHRSVKVPVGTDMMPYSDIDYGVMHQALDLVQFNHYNKADNLWQAALWFDFIRPIKARPFWNTETQTCWNGSVAANGYKEPGFCRVNSWLPIALGGEANLYWLWRQHWSGQELMHGAVVSASGRPLHIFGEVQEISAGFRAAADFLNDAPPIPTPLALVFSQRSARMSAHQPMVNGFNYHGMMMDKVYHPLLQAHLRLDAILPMAELSKYKMIFSPFLLTLDESGFREKIKSWIEAGGAWIVGPLSDIRNEHAAKFTHAPYGSLEEWGGVYCKYELPGDPRDFKLRWNDGRESEGALWYDGLELRGAEALATYTEGPLAGLAAVARKKLGKGQIIILGTMPRAQELQALLLSLGKEVGIYPVADASENLLVVPRRGPAGAGMVIVELENRPGRITLPAKMKDLLTDKELSGKIAVPPYAVMVLKEI
jgi:beta-galactosidase GanA